MHGSRAVREEYAVAFAIQPEEDSAGPEDRRPPGRRAAEAADLTVPREPGETSGTLMRRPLPAPSTWDDRLQIEFRSALGCRRTAPLVIPLLIPPLTMGCLLEGHTIRSILALTVLLLFVTYIPSVSLLLPVLLTKNP